MPRTFGRFTREESRRVLELLRHPLSPFKRRTLVSILVLATVMAVGTEGMVLLEGWSYVDAFYFMSLIATTQGPTRNPVTDAGKIFASGMAFIAVGAVISSIAFFFGPLFGTLLKEGMDYLEKEERRVKERIEGKPAEQRSPSRGRTD